MSARTYTEAEKLAAVERAIEMYRRVVAGFGGSVRDPSNEHHDTFHALKAVAVDYREKR